VASPHIGEGTETTWGLDVADETHAYHRWGLEDGHPLGDLLLVELGARAVHLADHVGHTSLVAHEGCEVRRLSSIILWEALDLTLVVLGPLTWQKPRFP